MAIWGESKQTNQLYEDRVSGKAEEMGCAKQLVDILKPLVSPGMTVLDVGCGAGYFYHSLNNIGLEYYGVDPTEEYINIGRNNLPKHGLDPERLQVKGIDEISGRYDIVVCFSVLQHLPVDLEKYLKILTDCAKSVVITRSSFHDKDQIVRENGIDIEDPDKEFPTTTYPKIMVEEGFKKFGFDSKYIIDNYTGGKPEKIYANDVFIFPGIYLAQKVKAEI